MGRVLNTDKFAPPTKGEWYLGADQQYISHEHRNFVAFDVVNRKVVWRGSPAPFCRARSPPRAGWCSPATCAAISAIDAGSGKVLWHFSTGSGIIGSDR
jgi:hypothetical protein